MQNIATLDNEDRYLLAYKEVFLEKYGQYGLVSFLEAVDPDKGLGLPYSGYIADVVAKKYDQKSSKKLNSIKTMLENKILTTLKQGHSVMQITNRDIESIAMLDSKAISQFNFTSSYSLNVFVAKTNNDYEIYIGPNVGSSQAGNGISRFDSALNADFSQEMDEIYSKEKMFHDNEYVIADVYELSHHLRNTNLYSYKRQYDYNLHLGVVELAHHKDISLNDLYLGYDRKKNRLFVWSKSLNKKVKFITNSMYSVRASNPVVRLLRSISLGYEIQLIDNLFLFRNLQYLYSPKIKYENIVLANEKWRFNPELFTFSSIDKFKQDFQEYIKIWNLPKYVYYVYADNRLILDLEDEFAYKLLYRSLSQKKQTIVLERMEYEDITSSVVSDGKNRFYAAEFTIPMFNFESSKQSPSTDVWDPTLYTNQNLIDSFYLPQRVLYPGDEGWLYFKLYINPVHVNNFLSNYLEPFLRNLYDQEIIKSFFFIKYSDPKFHIRLRLQIIKPDMLSNALQEFQEWFNLLQKNLICYEYVIAQYERELERYGGLGLIKYAETYFCYDSQLVIALVKEIGKDVNEIEYDKIGIFVIYNLVKSFYESIQSSCDFLVKYTNNIDYKDLFRRNKKEYMAIIEDDYGANFSENIQKIVTKRNAAIKQYVNKIRQLNKQHQLSTSIDNILLSIIHLFCNRYIGNRKWEERIFFLTRHAVYTMNNKLIHNKKPTKKKSIEN